MQKEFLNEESYQQTNTKVKKIGKVLLIIGACLLGLGFIFLLCGLLGFGGQISSGFAGGQESINPTGIFGGFGLFAVGAFLMPPGFLLTAVGVILRFFIGNRREITAYTAQQVMPVAQEGIEKMAPTFGTVAKEISKGIHEGKNEANK